MCFRKKVLVLALFIVFVAAACGFSVIAETAADGDSAEGTYVLAKDGATLTADKSTLNFSVTKNGRTWFSGKRASEDDGLNNQWVNKLTDAVTVGYFVTKNNNQTERSLSMLKSSITFKEKSDGFEAKVKCKQISLSFTLVVKLSSDGVTLKIPFDSVKESSESYRLQYITLCPFFDASYGLQSGKIIIPDGSGASIDLNKSSGAKQPYSARVYGSDYGVSSATVSSNSPHTASMPLFATLYDDGGTVTTVKSGAEYATINAYTKGITTDYNLVYFTYVYRESFVRYYQSAGSEGKSYVALQDQMNRFDIEQKMTFLGSGCSLSDVAAVAVKEFDVKKTSEVVSTGLRVKFLMSESKQGLFGNETVNLTTTSFVQNAVNEIKQYAGNLSVSLLGYNSGGLSRAGVECFPLDGLSGGNGGYKKLLAAANEQQVRLSLHVDPVKIKEDEFPSGYKAATNLAEQYITVGDNRVGSDVKFLMLSAVNAQSYFDKNNKKFGTYANAVDLDSVGYMLFTDTNDGIDRKQSADKYRQMIESCGVGVSLYRPNMYLWNVCQGYLDMPLDNSGYIIETESVPLLQMILSGKMPMYSRPVNLNYSSDNDVLKLIDYNVYPSFLLTEQNSIELHGTDSVDIFTSAYSDWNGTVRQIFRQVDAVLGKVVGCGVTDRIQNEDYAVTTYDNGVKVIVNYGSSDIDLFGITIKACSAQAI